MNDEYGQKVYDSNILIEELLKGNDISKILVHQSEEFEKYNQVVKEFDYPFDPLEYYQKINCSKEEFHKNNQKIWNIPEEYLNIDIVDFLLDRVSAKEEFERVEYELCLFEKTNSLILLNLMIYLVDNFRKNNILWGVGRGSSVSCYCFYIIGIHRVNSLKYKLDPFEFFKVK